MLDVEPLNDVRDFIENGGNVLLVIAAVTVVMWTYILERYWYFRMGGYRRDNQQVLVDWNARADHSSWNAHQIRRLLISQLDMKLSRGLGVIRIVVAVCPMLGLLGTVTGMIEVFDVMAAGSGNTRGMAGGVSKATLPTMAGMVAALSGMLFSIQLERFAGDEVERVSDRLEVVHES